MWSNAAMSLRPSFPSPVNEVAARITAGGAVILGVLAIALPAATVSRP
jgi:hypothetical protein